MADDFTIADNDDPDHVFATYRDLQQRCPVAHTSDYGGYWALTRHSDVRAAATNSELFISSVKAVVPSDPRGIRRPPLNFDAPRHTPFRRALLRTLSASRVEEIVRTLEPRAETLFQEFLAADHDDISQSFGTMLPAYAAATWLNLDEERVEWLASTATAWIAAWRNQDKEQVSIHSEEMYAVARWLVDDRAKNPHHGSADPATSLLAERVDGQPLDPELIVGALRQSLVVGMVAPPLLFGSMVRHLAENPDIQDDLRRHPDRRQAATEEYIRLFTPYRGFARTVSRTTEIAGRIIEPDEPVTLVYAAANRDPAVFPEPDKFDANRSNISQHLGFGVGRHQCVGMHLARGIIRVGLDALLDGSSSLELVAPPIPTRMPELGYQTVFVRAHTKQKTRLHNGS
ncbi:cytochrome [Rhodococcus sp. 06-621-2]|nr:cytochrome P450 [Rhodococcus sp. 06-621-2]OZC53653.1 cytochrome [Rhodococcus sp. 06-621-2]